MFLLVIRKSYITIYKTTHLLRYTKFSFPATIIAKEVYFFLGGRRKKQKKREEYKDERQRRVWSRTTHSRYVNKKRPTHGSRPGLHATAAFAAHEIASRLMRREGWMHSRL